jgi:cysteine sulfinate desulfinase/cysteine desulfurase-like protein
MNQVFDALFLKWFDERRQVRQLSIQSLWVSSGKKNTDGLFTIGKKDTRKILTAEKTIVMATLIYDTKVAFISSQTEAFGFIVESAEFVQSEREKFASLWISTK